MHITTSFCTQDTGDENTCSKPWKEVNASARAAVGGNEAVAGERE